MDSEKTHIEREPTPRDISREFQDMDAIEFIIFSDTLRDEPSLSIVIDWPGLDRAKRLKAFLEDSRALRRGQKRIATIRCTEKQRDLEAENVFASGVKFEKVEE